ncbi:MAG: 50S ribosomal protein L5 [Candidatus Diapherotrites archaeon]
MKQVRLEKVTINMGVGQAGEELKKAEEILKRVTDRKPVQTVSKSKIPTWGLREGLPIGVKVTLRGKPAAQFLEKAFHAKEKKLKGSSFDKWGNFGFGVKEYIDLPGAKYDPKLGIRGFDVLVSLEKAGYRVKRRKLKTSKVGKAQGISKEEAIAFVQQNFGVEVE